MLNQEGLPIAEEFCSIQGEGAYVGTPMYFIRLAGCNVGRPAKALKLGPFPVLPTNREASACTLWDGRTFPCDTDYDIRHRKTHTELCRSVLESGLKHVCITGGEPLMHHSKLIRLCIALHELRDVLVHVETSGTIFHELSECYVTVSPKISCLERMVHRADELKFLVDENFDEANLTPAMLKHRKVFVQPVNGILKIDEQNLNRCKELVVKHPTWRVSFQAHKFYNWR